MSSRITATWLAHDSRITASEKSPILKAQFQPDFNQIRTGSQPLRNRRSTCFRVESQAHHSRNTAKCDHSHIIAISQHDRHTTTVKSPINLRQARTRTESQLYYSRTTPESDSNHSHIATTSHPKHCRITSQVQPNCSYTTLESQPLSRFKIFSFYNYLVLRSDALDRGLKHGILSPHPKTLTLKSWS